MKQAFIITALTALLLCSFASPLLAATNPNPSPDTLKNGILPTCDPGQTDLTKPNACGLDSAQQLIYNIISYVSYIVIPIATLLLGYAGFTIMTAAGNSEKITKAKGMISKVVIGIAIIFLSSLLVRYIFFGLGVTTDPNSSVINANL